MGKGVLVIDTNIILEVILRQGRAIECAEFFNRIARDEQEVVITSFTICSVGIIGISQKLYNELSVTYQTLNKLPHLQRFSTSAEDEFEIVRISESLKLSFDDALQYYVARKLNAALVSFDRDFDQTDLKRVEPKDVLAELSA